MEKFMIRLFHKNKLMGVYGSVFEAEAQARWIHFELTGDAAPGTEMPYNFLILIENVEVNKGAVAG